MFLHSLNKFTKNLFSIPLLSPSSSFLSLFYPMRRKEKETLQKHSDLNVKKSIPINEYIRVTRTKSKKRERRKKKEEDGEEEKLFPVSRKIISNCGCNLITHRNHSSTFRFHLHLSLSSSLSLSLCLFFLSSSILIHTIEFLGIIFFIDSYFLSFLLVN